MPTLSPAAIYDLARGAGLSASQATVATAIALAESGGRTDAVGDTTLANGTWGPSVGLWQIRSLRAETGTGSARDVNRLTDPAHNARAMVEISGGGANWRPWSVYTSGAYTSHLGQLAGAGVGVGTKLSDTRSTWERNTDALGDAVADLNPFTGWSDDLLGVGIKVGATVAAGALLIIGLNRAVSA